MYNSPKNEHQKDSSDVAARSTISGKLKDERLPCLKEPTKIVSVYTKLKEMTDEDLTSLSASPRYEEDLLENRALISSLLKKCNRTNVSKARVSFTHLKLKGRPTKRAEDKG